MPEKLPDTTANLAGVIKTKMQDILNNGSKKAGPVLKAVKTIVLPMVEDLVTMHANDAIRKTVADKAYGRIHMTIKYNGGNVTFDIDGWKEHFEITIVYVSKGDISVLQHKIIFHKLNIEIIISEPDITKVIGLAIEHLIKKDVVTIDELKKTYGVTGIYRQVIQLF